MSVAGVIAAALRNDAPYAAEIQMGAQLILDFQGARTGGRPYYWYRGTRYSTPDKIPGWTWSRPSTATDEGLVDDIVTNKVTCWNGNPTEAAGFVGNPVNMSKTGDAASILSVVSDASALAAAGLSGVCTSGKVYKLDNSAGSAGAKVQITGPVGNTNPHTITAWWRGSGTGGVGLTNNIGSIVSVPGAYTRYGPTLSPTGGLVEMAVQAQAGAVVFFILPQLIERAAPISLDIVTQGAAASAVVGRVNGLIPVASGVPRIGAKGLLVEDPRVNLLKNGNLVGASGATPPDHWSVEQQFGGLSPTEWAVRSVNGYPGASFRVVGTTTVINRLLLSATGFGLRVAVTAGQTFSISYNTQVLGGSYPYTIAPQFLFYDAGGALLSALMGTTVTPTASNVRSSSAVVVPAGAVTANVRFDFSGYGVSGSVVDFTMFIGAVEFGPGSFPASYIPTTSAQATRAIEPPNMSLSLPPNGTIVCNYWGPPAGYFGRGYVWSVKDGGLDRLACRSSESGLNRAFVVVGDGASLASLVGPTTNPGALVKTALAYSTTQARAVFVQDGNLSQAGLQLAASALAGNTINIAQSGIGLNSLGSQVALLMVFDRSASDAQLLRFAS